MRKVFLRTLFLFLLFFLHLEANQKNFRVSYDPDYAPFSYLENNHPEGLLIDFWKLWAQKNNYNITFVNGKLWEEAINLVHQGKVDFFLGTFPYEKWMKASNSFYKTKTSMFIQKDNSKGFSKDAAYIIGIIGSDYEQKLKVNFPNSEVVVYENYKNIFRDFLAKKIDLIYDDKIAIEYYALRNNYFHKIRDIDLLNDFVEIKAIAKDDAFIKTFNKGFEKLTFEELYDIESKWIINSGQQIYKSNIIELTKEEKDFIKNHTIKVALSESWKPFNFKSDSNEASGISYEIFKTISKMTGLKTEFTFYKSFSNILNSIKTKKEDLLISVDKTKDRKKYSLFTKPYVSFPLSIVTLKDENFIENIEYLFDKKIAVGKNFTAHKILKERYPNIDLLIVKNIKEGLLAVKNKKAYAYVDIKPSLTYNINKLGLNELKISGNTGFNFDVRMMIRDDYPLLKSILDKSIENLPLKDTELIISKWDNVQFETDIDYSKLWTVLLIIVIIFAILIYFNQLNIRRNKTLKLLVNERTKELKKLNEELEVRVEQKTKELTRTNYLLDEAQKIARLGSFSYNIEKDILKWSIEYYKIFGLNPNDITPTIKKFLSFVHKDDRKMVRKNLLNSIKDKKRYSFEFRILTKNKKIKYLQTTSQVTKYNSNEKATFLIGTVLDLTRVKELELGKREQDTLLAQQSKMAAMGEMLENIAHQWRQPLSVISTASTGMQLQLEINNQIPEDILKDSIKSINEQSQYLSKTIEDFRNFFKPNKRKEIFNIKESLEKSLYLINTRIKRNKIEILKDMDDIKIKTLESELIQVYLNILNNAIDALISNKIENKYILISTYKNDDFIFIEIKDNAGGIPKKILNRILEPYFTTKHKSQGTGIGLYMSNEIITKHLKGEIIISNCSFVVAEENYRGADFTLKIPLENLS